MIISILHAEKQIQLQDLTRFDASKSLLVKGSTNPINSVKIRAGANATEVELFNANPKNWFLDWAFSEYAFDVDASNSDVTFELNNAKQTINVPSSTYTLSNLLTAIKDALETAVPTLTVSVTLDERNRITINPNLPLKFMPKATGKELLQHLGFVKDGQLEGAPVEYGLRKVTLTVSSVSESASIDQYVEVYTAQGDALFSEDADLIAHENDILKWLPNGRGSFLDLHRRAQRLILDWLDRQGYRDDNFEKLTKWAFVDNSDVRTWSTYKVLGLFFQGAHNQTDDVFKRKAEYYKKLEIEARDRAVLSLDLNGDGKPDQLKGPDIRSGRLFFR